MYCRKCGKQAGEGTAFCPYCGEALGAGGGTPLAAAFESASGNKKKKSVMPAVFLAALLIAGGIGAALYFTGDGYKCKKSIEQAEQYLEEGEYEEALACCGEALELDDEYADAYLISADIYIELEAYGKAAKILEKGRKAVKDKDELCSLLEEKFEPSKLKASEEEYMDLVQDNGMANADVEDEVLRIRGIYNEIVQKRTNGQYMESAVKDGVTMYTENGEVQCIIAKKGVDGVPYARYYYFENGSLIFAYLEAGDSHRLYFNNGRLFRWRYASDAVNFSEADNHDNEDSEEFREWENLALDDIYNYGGVCRV